MSLAEAVKYVFAAYAVVLIVLCAYYLLTVRRVARMQRELDLLKDALDERGREDGGSAPDEREQVR